LVPFVERIRGLIERVSTDPRTCQFFGWPECAEMFENAERSQASDNIALAEPSFARRSQCAGGSEPSQGSDNIA
jgi:hypothetical protein